MSFRPSEVLRQPLHGSTLCLLSRREDDPKSGAICYVLLRQLLKGTGLPRFARNDGEGEREAPRSR
ncbi:hypothetical protein ACCAA_1460002 [Candidatus Accumulibacter aalborgensis]|uniref:Uncharacterized protein n=1 Tax=Candidatus Accumulibacter aalborgensis TaxID=1860102 RepID=A0A1A8XKL0_9PROT|nr:hypothetical protein ACCAA_1460002 [Candidatus Accumulibacter aalborgensis]